MIKSLQQEDCMLLLSQHYVGHLAYIYHNEPFIVPITYFYKNNRIICYSNEGHKINALRLHGKVALEVAEIKNINSWRSVVAHGVYEELDGCDAKALLHEFSLGVKEVVMRTERRDLDYISEFSAKINKDEVAVIFVIHIEEFTGKMRQYEGTS
ncbi:pyridoxamine 5'-phosphate oxidase family protein [Winogradskyella arenosi]|uniref:Nitroimidazol reductase NimA-like FMN-containing flavoprotein (Pyridoxamine 5'-phosphate oxidase superfamily) n=1 Tax=Winogradskyella arenosi TaxID=533325 RepID=A0A368ZL48_9FLAO|nr:pyridoxamine 5'-phosphate oxidase family protein [Winogradskyella arenosi]RCW93296.1 hypothetical protein DFQ08_10188 [Winogradskyella arenosi]